ncbi:cobalamin-binding protein [Oscillatoria salina]|uniref:cobalamin-binding protein n=1 Tax=Oscillatoria salina TaxID=331517 RepID=UPI0013B70E65|nr:cobalamin-binding protein [Oscillatoria salina]MBZ8182113.1 cobalamin-binding protein [Oscillatoria salina IIICB1]NET87358.1 cobalamin-binding protein [Kamptonema sp. SIO1D9]
MTQENDLRIVSLLPSATEIVAVLGLTEKLVGVSHECDYPPEVKNLPICTEARLNSAKPSVEIDADVADLIAQALSIYQIKTETIEQLKPTHIITQDQCDVCAVSFGDVEKAVDELTQSNPKVISLQPNLLTEVWADIKRVGRSLNVESQPVLKQLQARIDACTNKTKVLSEVSLPSVVALEWIDPLMASGNWIPEMIKLAGGKTEFGLVGEHSPYLEWENLVKADPEVIIIMPCGFDLQRTRQEIQALTEKAEWSNLQAVKNKQVYLTDGNAYFNRPGPRLGDSLEILAEILHPDLFSFGYEGTAWERLQK